MKNLDQDQQDPRNVPGVEDTTAMTIEFLRARLLSERSVSRTAKQRADELAKRVAELEEQLKIVSLQRKMAEKATADVLAILEDNGASDVSETLDSNSDEETPCESKVGDDPTKEDVHSSSSLKQRNGHEELSGSDLDTTPVLGGSLSWKGRNDPLHAREKLKNYSVRSRSSIASVGSSSPKHHLGRSCRQIKRRDTRPLDGDRNLKIDTVDSSQGIAQSACSEDSPNCSDNGTTILRDKSEFNEKTVLLSDPCSGSSQDNNDIGNKDHDLDECGRSDDMEKALKCQAQLIDRYEAMEKAQREWEEKFRENNNSTPDSCDPGNHSDITEERDEIRAQAPNISGNACLANEVKSLAAVDCVSKDLSEAQTKSLVPVSRPDVEDLQDHNTNNTSNSRCVADEFTFPMTNVKQSQEEQYNTEHKPSSTSQLNHEFLDKPLSSSHVSVDFSDREAPGSKNDQYALVPHEPPALNGVLEALKQAKLSLEKKIKPRPVIEGDSTGKSIGNLSATKTGDRLEIPIGCAGLFRLPTDFAAEASSQFNFTSSNSLLRSATHYPNDTIPTSSANHQYFPSHEMEDRRTYPRDSRLVNVSYTGSGNPRDDRGLTRQFPENGWRNLGGQNHHFDRYIDANANSNAMQPSPYVYNYPSPQVSSSLHSNESFMRNFPGRAVGIPPTNQYSLYDDQIRPNMYR